MFKKISKIVLAGALSLSLIGGAVIGQGAVKVEATSQKVLPDNHTIEQLEVKWLNDGSHGYTIDIGKRKGTLLIRIDPPKVERDVEWLNWSITKPLGVNFPLYPTKENSKANGYFDFSITYERYLKYQGYPDKQLSEAGIVKSGIMKFSDYSYPNYYVGMALYLDKPYSKDGIYWFGGNSYALKEDGQVKAYFFENKDVVVEAYDRIKSNGNFPLMNKVMWGKTELWKGQLGKVTIKQPSVLWKRLDNGKLEKVRDLIKGDEYRVYRYLDERNGLYGVGAGMFIEKNPASVLYETPSKRNLRLVRIMNGEE